MLLVQLCAIAVRLWDDMRSPASFMKLHSAPAKASDDCGAYSEMTDEEFIEMVRLARHCYWPSAESREHKVFLRIPDADPSNMGPDAEDNLKSMFEAEFPGYTVTDITFQRGSLLVGVRVTCPVEAVSPSSAGSSSQILMGVSNNTDSSSQMLKGVSNTTWLSWLRLPMDLGMSGKVDVPTDRRVKWLDGFPMAASVPRHEKGFATVSFPLQCSQSPQDVALKASLGACALECSVLASPSDEGEPNIGPGAKQSSVYLEVKLHADALRGSPCCLLTENVQSLTDHVIVGDRTVVLLLDDLTDMESDLCSLHLLHHSDEKSLDLPFDLEKQLYGAHIVYAVGSWLQTMNIERQRQRGGGGGRGGGGMDYQQLDRMWRAGNRLMLHLVGNGCTAAAKHVVHVLLCSPALRPFVHQRMQREGSDCTGRFYDYFGGEINHRGSSMLHLAIKSGCYAMVDEVLRWTQAYKLPSLWVVQDQFGMTPLHLAVLINEGGMSTFLLEKRRPALLRAWHYNGGRAGSPEKFWKRMARIPQAAGGMGDQHGRRSPGLRTPALQRDLTLVTWLQPVRLLAVFGSYLVRAATEKRDVPTVRSLLQDPTPTPTLPAVKAPAPESGGVDPTAAGSDHIAHGQPRDGLPPKLPHAESVLAVPTTCLGLAGLHPWYRLMKQLWSNLEPWPNAEQQNKFVMYKLETMSMIMKLFCFLQFFGHMSVALKGGLCLLSLHALLLACLFSIPTIRALYKRDYLFAEKLLFAYSFMRKAFSFHIITNVPFAVNFTLFVRLGRAVAEPIRFQWALAENLSMMVLNCLFYFGVSFHWALLCHVLGLLTTVVLEMQHRKQFLALEKSL